MAAAKNAVTPITAYNPPKGFVRPTVSIEDFNQDLDAMSEQSPEPSPLAPPEPQQLPSPTTMTRDHHHPHLHHPRQSPAQQPPVTSASVASSHRRLQQQQQLPHTPYSSKSRASTHHSSGSNGETEHNNDSVLAEDESIPHQTFSMPEAPSPYSPPPASLFSEMEGHELPKQRTRRTTRSSTIVTGTSQDHQRPVREVHLHHNGSNPLSSRPGRQSRLAATTPTSKRRAEEDEEEEEEEDDGEDDVSTAVQQRSTASTTTSHLRTDTDNNHHGHTTKNLKQQNTSNLFHVLLQLKTDLQNAHQSLFLSQQENKALRSQFDAEQSQWQEELDDRVARERQLVHDELCEEHGKEMADLREQLQQVEEEEQFLNDQLDTTQKERDEVQATLADCQSQLKTVQADAERTAADAQAQHDAQLERQVEAAVAPERQARTVAEAAVQSLRVEVDYWKKELSTAHEEYRDKLASSATTQPQQMDELVAALEKAHTTIAELRAERLALRQELVNVKIRQQPRVEEAACQTEEEEVDLLLSHDMMPPLGDDLNTMGQDVSSISGEDDEEEDTPHQDQETRPSNAGWSVENHFGSPPANMVEQNHDQDAFHTQLSAVRAKHKEDIRQLFCSHNRSPPEEEGEEKRLSNIDEEGEDAAECFTGTDQPPLQPSYEKRIRQLEEQQQAQLLELKEQLTHDVTREAIRAVVSTLGEQNSRTTSPEGRPQSIPTAPAAADNDNPPASAEKGRDSLFASMKEELTRVVTEQIQTVLQTTEKQQQATSQPHQETGGDPAQLDHQVPPSNTPPPANKSSNDTSTHTDASAKAKRERQARRETELATLQREWKEETDQLLDSIQRECNQVFERTRTQRSRTSPRTVAVNDLSLFGGCSDSALDPNEGDQEPMDDPTMPPLGDEGSPPPPLLSSPGMDLDRTLDETEALVQSLMGTE